MSAKKKGKRDPIPESFPSEEAAGEFWDTHDLADYWDLTRPVDDLVFRIKHRTYLITLDPDLIEPLRAQARKNGTSSRRLVNRWLRERLDAGVLRKKKA